MNLLRQTFAALSLRERTLLLVFVTIGLLIWASSLLSSLQETRREHQRVQTAMENQLMWLSSQPEFEARLQASLERLDPSKTISPEQLQEKVDTLARIPELSFSLTNPTTQSGDVFDIHTVRIQIRNADLGALLDFDYELRQEAPYLGVESFQISSSQRDYRQLDATFQLYSFELKTNES